MEEERYIGSVRFYKHVILSVVGLLIVIPTTLCIVLATWNIKLNAKYMETAQALVAIEAELSELYQQVQAVEIREDYTETMVASAPKETVTVTVPGHKDDWNLILVNENSPIPESYEPMLEKIEGGKLVDTRIVASLTTMFQAMRAEGLDPMVCSGYRTIEKQHNLFEEDIQTQVRAGKTYDQAFYKAKEYTALPGASEHHTGLAVDIVGRSHQNLNKAQAKTREAIWLAEHCAEYGFILRYPADKTDVTGIAYESWHFRYVGEEAAEYIMENALALEEYVELLSE